MIYFC